MLSRVGSSVSSFSRWMRYDVAYYFTTSLPMWSALRFGWPSLKAVGLGWDEEDATRDEDPTPPDPAGFWTDAAAVLGLSGELPDCIDPESFMVRWSIMREHVVSGALRLDEARDMLLPEIGLAWARTAAEAAGRYDLDAPTLAHIADSARDGVAVTMRTAAMVTNEIPDVRTEEEKEAAARLAQYAAGAPDLATFQDRLRQATDFDVSDKLVEAAGLTAFALRPDLLAIYNEARSLDGLEPLDLERIALERMEGRSPLEP